MSQSEPMLCIYTENTLLPNHLTDSSIACEIINKQPETGVYLHYDEQGLSLCKAAEKGRVQVDFAAAGAEYRRIKGGGELIAKAVNHSSKPIVWDATAGLGRDAWVLASQSLQVKLFEQNAAVFLLLRDGIERAVQIPELADIAKQISLHFGNASDAMRRLADAVESKPDVVYLDPMYPERQKSAAVKKEMAYFHELIGQPERIDDEKLFQAAREVAKKRVVVKRPRLGEFLCQQKPAYQYQGRSTRFDVYLPL